MRQTPSRPLTDARRIVAAPRPSDSASMRRLAWALLKTARGQRVVQHRLPRAA